LVDLTEGKIIANISCFEEEEEKAVDGCSLKPHIMASEFTEGRDYERRKSMKGD
jgi:hypothetical protein